MRITKIQFAVAGKLYDFSAGTLELERGDKVFVETDRGKSIAIVAVPPLEKPDASLPEGIKPVLRKASPEEIEAVERFREKEREAQLFCAAKIRERNLDMKLVRVEYQYDGSKAVFFFTADGRIDFRELVKDLAHTFHIRIEMRQIGVRDEAKLVGGLGICGRELCCSTFLRDFAPVSVKMAKEQNLALNPTKISGQCGRLLCCLAYEHETYSDIRKSLPKCGKQVKCADGCCGEVIKQDIFRGTVTIKTANDKELVVKAEDLSLEPFREKPKKEEQPEKLRGDQGETVSPQTAGKQEKPQPDAKLPEQKTAEADKGKKSGGAKQHRHRNRRPEKKSRQPGKPATPEKETP